MTEKQEKALRIPDVVPWELDERFNEAASHYEVAARIGNLRFYSATADAIYLEHSEKARTSMERIAADFGYDYQEVLDKVRIWFKG